MRRPAIALFLDHPIGEYQEEIRQVVERAATERGLNVYTVIGRALDAPRRSEAAMNAVYELVTARSVVGVILAGVVANRSTPEHLVTLRDRLRPLALCAIGAEIPGVPLLAIHNGNAMRLMLDHMQAHERQRVAFIRGPSTSDEAQQRYEAYLTFLRENQLEFVPELVDSGHYDLASGAEAMLRILARGVPFDAVVASNDNMALGAVEVLQAQGLRVPQQVLVGGFDDSPVARFSNPPLTTVRQPIQQLGRKAVELLLEQLAGRPVAELTEVGSELVLRQSCGCAFKVLHGRKSVLPRAPAVRPLELVQKRRPALRKLVNETVRIAADVLEPWLERLLQGLQAELLGSRGRFLFELEDVLEMAVRQHEAVEEFHAIVSILRAEMKSTEETPEEIVLLDDLWHAAGILIGIASARAEGRERLASEFAASVIRDSIARLATTLSHGALRAGLLELLPAVKIPRALVALWSEHESGTLECFFSTHAERAVTFPNPNFRGTELFPPEFVPEDEAVALMFQPLTFEEEQLGLLVLQTGASSVAYDILREQISASLKGASLHRSLVREAALRERAERAQLEGELRIAEQIQVAILPVATRVPWLSLASGMVTAQEVGGDYYDILPMQDVCWIGIGDVTGHGLKAGLVMLMIQSMVSSLVQHSPKAEPSTLVNALNAALFRNVRERLQLDDHATFSLLRVEPTGVVTWAGAHEDLVIWRKQSGRCEIVASVGAWIGARSDVSYAMTDQTLQLEPGDRLFLYTDGLIEAMDSEKAQFGIERVCALLESFHELDDERLCSLIISDAKRFATVQQDDITALILRLS